MCLTSVGSTNLQSFSFSSYTITWSPLQEAIRHLISLFLSTILYSAIRPHFAAVVVIRLRRKIELPFLRSRRVRIKRVNDAERPQNSVTSALDLSVVYGTSSIRYNALSTGFNGHMAVSAGGLLKNRTIFS